MDNPEIQTSLDTQDEAKQKQTQSRN